MTLAGTRPPTVDEWDKYELHHRARLATKPGLTGMWQVSGRSNITDLIPFVSYPTRLEHQPIEGLYVIEPTVHGDDRGYFMETYNLNDMKEAGLDMNFVQDNQSMSTKGVLRGLHFQKQYPQGKLVRAIKGRVFDVAVDLRSDSKTYGQWYGVELTEENKKQFYISEGFAHGFLVLSDTAELSFMISL